MDDTEASHVDGGVVEHPTAGQRFGWFGRREPAREPGVQ